MNDLASGGRRPATASDAAYLAAIVESSDDAIIGKDLDGRIAAWNPAARALFGYDAEDILGQHVSILFPPDRLQEEEAIMAAIRRGQRLEHYRTTRRRKDGDLVHVSLTVSPIMGDGGKIIGASKIVRDITAQMQTEARLEELQLELLHVSRLSAMGQMAAAIAHELNQPLSAASNYTSGARRVLLNEPADVALAVQGLDRALTQVQRIGDIIRRLRTFVERGVVEHRTEDLSQVVQEAIDLLGPAMRGQCTLSFTADPDLEPVLIDRVQVQQVLLNLFRNAIEAMAQSPVRQLTVAVLSDPGAAMVRVRVADTGPGIAPAVAERLFQPFVSSKDTGMGVGLSICRTIAEAHGGRIWADSNPSGGAVFTLALPTLDAESAEPPTD